MKQPDILDELIFNYRFNTQVKKQKQLSRKWAVREFINRREELYQKLSNWFNQ